MALRTFLSGLSAHLSHLLRCKGPQTLEEAINMVVEEENMNYNRQQKIGHRQIPQKNSSTLRTTQISPSSYPRTLGQTTPSRPNPSTFRSQANIPHRPTNFFTQRTPQQTFQSRNFQTPQTHFRQNISNPQNNFLRTNFQNSQNNQNIPQNQNSQRQRTYPQPMDTSSGNTRRTTRNPNTTNPRWTSQELYLQENVNTNPDEHFDLYEDPLESPEIFEEEFYAEENYPEANENYPEDENFTIPASEIKDPTLKK